MGRYVVNRLGKIGSQVICPYRGEPYYMKDLKLAGDLGQILFLAYDIRDEASLRKVMKYSNVVINLVGKDNDTLNFKLKDVHVDGAERVARIAKECGVEKLIHFSAMNASPNPTPCSIKGGSNFLKTKFEGEMRVREEFPEAIIFRPADIFGPEDRFTKYYASPWRRQANVFMPLWKRGTRTVKMPVFCSDVADGVVKALMDPEAEGKTFECVGPHSYLLSELVDYFFRCMRFETHFRVPLNPLFTATIKMMELPAASPLLSAERIERESVSDILTGVPTLEALNVKLTKLEDRAAFEFKAFRRHSYYEEKVGEFPDPTPPAILA
jgi:NADH dehydrogenase (ubiquinone) 1 alpha subcomplex subunit 9